ncbi:MAG: hypothetical protein V9G29_19395 [Burkholderiaceae bacterium]
MLENVGDRPRREGAALVRLGERGVDLVRTVLVEEVEQARRRASEVSAMERDVAKERLGAGARREEAVATAVAACRSLFVGEAREVRLLLDLLLSVPASYVHRHLAIPVQDPDGAHPTPTSVRGFRTSLCGIE